MALKNSLISNDVRQEFSVGASRALGLHKAEDIQHLDGTALLHIQSLLGHGSDWGVWQTPRNWFPGGYKAGWSVCIKDRINSLLPVNLRSVHVRECDSHQLLCQLIDDSLLMCIRYLILCRIGPMSLVNWRDSLDPSVIAQIAYSHLPKLAVIGIEKELNKANLLDQIANKRQNKTTQSISCFSLINYEDIDTLSSAISTKQCLKNEIKRMHAAFTRKLWGDVPDVRIDISKITQVRGHQLKQQQERTSSPHLPLPDEFVGEIGQKSYWLIKHLGPNLLCILNDFQEIWKDAAVRGIDARNLSETCRKYLSVYSWRDAEGVVIKNLPFDMRLNQRGSQSKKTSASLRFESQSIGSSIESSGMSEGTKSASWPPRGAAHIFGLTRALQGAHLFVIGLSTGARNGEALVMERGCVTRAPDGIPYANGKTYKLVRRHEGQLRDWPLPALAEAAFEQQAKLICLVERLSPLSEISAVVNPSKVIPGIGLWFASNDRGAAPTSATLQQVLKGYVLTLGMETKPGGQLIRPHRLRKTLARMVALAVAHAPKVLQDVFGHDSIEMTIYYILTDKSLAAEIDVIAKELRVMRCTDVIASIVATESGQPIENSVRRDNTMTINLPTISNCGGRAAEPVRQAVADFGRELHRTSQEWGAESIGELAQILTIGGTTWDLVRPGVICTKSLGEFGPCNKKRGHADPANCQTSCDHRLEEAWIREDVDRCLGDSVEEWQRQTEAGHDLVAEFWAGQVRMHAERFPDLKLKWIKDPRVAALLSSIGSHQGSK